MLGSDGRLSMIGRWFGHLFCLLAMVAGILMSCQRPPGLSGSIAMTDQDWAPMVYLIDPLTFQGLASSYLGQVVDSAKIDDDGRFSFDQGPLSAGPKLWQMAIQRKGERHHNKLEMEDWQDANYFPFVWRSGDRINISTTANHFQRDLTMRNPSSENAALLQLRDLRLEAYQKYQDEIDGGAHDASSLLQDEKALLKFQEPVMQFAHDSPFLLPALLATRWVSPVGNYERIPEFIFGQCQKWTATDADHPWVKELCKIGNRKVLPIMKGDLMLDFPMPMVSGDTASLSLPDGTRKTHLIGFVGFVVCTLQARKPELLGTALGKIPRPGLPNHRLCPGWQCRGLE